GRLHRPLLVRDDDELRAVRVLPQEADETADVRIVERRLDLVQEVERARPREEERKQEGDRAERLLAARKQRQTCDALAGRARRAPAARLGFSLLIVRGQPESALASWEQRRGRLDEVLLDGSERGGKPLLHPLGELGSEPLQLREAALEVVPLQSELVE